MKSAYSVKELTSELGISRTQVYRLINAGKLHPRKLGAKTVFLGDEVRRFLDSLPAVAA